MNAQRPGYGAADRSRFLRRRWNASFRHLPISLVAAVVLATGLFAGGCTQDEDVSTPPTTAGTTTPTAVQTPTPVTPTATPGASRTWVQPATEHNEPFRFSYPSGWFVEGEPPPAGFIGFTLSITSWDRTLVPPSAGPEVPEGEVKANLYVVPVGQAGCVPLEGETVLFGGLAGRARVRNAPFTEPPEQYLTRIIEIGGATSLFEYCLNAFFTAQPPDETGIRLIIDTFEVDKP